MQGAQVSNVLHETLPLASCSRDFGCVMMLAKGCVPVTLGHLTVLAVMFVCLLCYAHLPARRLAHCKDSFSTLSSFFWKVHHARWAFNTYLIFEVGSGMWRWKTQCRSFVLQKASLTQWHVEYFEREAQTLAQSLEPEHRHHWKQSPGKFKWGNDKWGWLPISTNNCKEGKMDCSPLEDIL